MLEDLINWIKNRKWRDQEFESWYANYSRENQLSPNPYDRKHFYDYNAWFEAMKRDPEQYNPQRDWTDYGRMHAPSEFKLAGHPTYFKNGINTRTGQPVRW